VVVNTPGLVLLPERPFPPYTEIQCRIVPLGSTAVLYLTRSALINLQTVVSQAVRESPKNRNCNRRSDLRGGKTNGPRIADEVMNVVGVGRFVGGVKIETPAD